MKRKLTFILSLLLVVLFAVTALTGCNDNDTYEDTAPPQETDPGSNGEITPIVEDGATIGEGSTTIRVEVTDADGGTIGFYVNTDAETVGDALLEVELIDGDVSEFGMMVTHVNGIHAEFNQDNAWWAFYVDGEMSMAGVDSVEVVPEAVYAFIHTPA